MLDIKGTNINGEGVIVGWQTPFDAAEQYAATPSWSRAVNHPSAHGRSFHVGGGLWVYRCHHCDAFTLSWGSLPIYAQNGIGEHEVTAHDAAIPGINVGLLSNC